MKKFNYRRIILIVLFVVLTITSLFIGVSKGVTLKALLQGNKEAWLLFRYSRWPRTMAIILSASALSVGGLIMQSIGRNKFISPSTVGTTDSAMLGVLLSYLLIGSKNVYSKFLFAFVFAFLSTFIFMKFLSKLKHRDIAYIPLLGIMYGSVIAAFTTFIAMQTDSLDIINQLMHGQFTSITRSNYLMLLIVIVPLVLSFIFATRFSIVSAGEDFATNLGVKYNRVVMFGLLLVSLISVTTFLTVGPLPFIGLIIPNLISKFYGDNVKNSILDVVLFGAVFVLINDIIARVIIYPSEISVSLVMGVIGAVIFLTMILKGVRKWLSKNVLT